MLRPLLRLLLRLRLRLLLRLPLGMGLLLRRRRAQLDWVRRCRKGRRAALQG
jgi:hypothetical protein